MHGAFATFVSGLVAAQATAVAPWMDDTALNKAFSGKTIQGHYASG